MYADAKCEEKNLSPLGKCVNMRQGVKREKKVRLWINFIIYHQGSSVCIVGKNYEEELDNLSKITQDYLNKIFKYFSSGKVFCNNDL